MFERILERLLDPSEDVRLEAIQMIETWGEEAGSMLLDLVDLGINDPSDKVREAITHILHSLSKKPLLPPETLGPFLVRILSSAEAERLRRGMRTLAFLGPIAPPAPYQTILKRARFGLFTSIREQIPFPSPEISAWMQSFFDLTKVACRYPNDLHVRLEAFHALEALAQDSPPSRSASQAKYALDWPSLRPVLEDALSDYSSRVRVRACRFLAQMESHALEAIPLLIKKACERQTGVTKVAYETLQKLNSLLPEATRKLLEILHHPRGLSPYAWTPNHVPSQRIEYFLQHAKLTPDFLHFFACKCAERALWLAYRAGLPAPLECELALQLHWSVFLGKITKTDAAETSRSLATPGESSSPAVAVVQAALSTSPEKAAKQASKAAIRLARTCHPNKRRTDDDRAEAEASWQIARVFDVLLKKKHFEALGALTLPLSSAPPQTDRDIVLESALFD